MKTKRAHRGMSLGQAMKMAKKHYKGGAADEGEVKGAGPVEDMMAKMKGAVGARRRKTRRGGALSPLPLGGRRKTRKWRLF